MIFILLILFSIYLQNKPENNPYFDLVEALKKGSPTPRQYAPWRANFTKIKDANLYKKSCILCKCVNNTSKINYIIKRFKHNILMLNLYPYTPWGNFLIVPLKHTKNIYSLGTEAKIEIMEIIEICQALLLKEVDGINVGINLGEHSGASIPDHLHVHIITRKKNESGFIDKTGNIIISSIDIKEQHKYFKNLFDNYKVRNI